MKVSSTNTRPERIVKNFLRKKKIKFQENVSGLLGTPDLANKEYKFVIFVNGCFWHLHDCGSYKLPKTNTDFWEKKVLNNYARDEKTLRFYKENNWHVFTIWECELKKDEDSEKIQLLYEHILNIIANYKMQRKLNAKARKKARKTYLL